MPERRPRVPEELAARIDVARGDVPFERWVRRALEQALSEASRSLRGEHESAGTPAARPSGQGDNPPAPARASGPPRDSPHGTTVAMAKGLVGATTESPDTVDPEFESTDGFDPPTAARKLFKAPCCDFEAPSPNAVCRAHGRKVKGV